MIQQFYYRLVHIKDKREINVKSAFHWNFLRVNLLSSFKGEGVTTFEANKSEITYA
jgi:hypothetical protein